MKKVVSLLCFVVALAMAENTIDLSGYALSHEVQEKKSKWTSEIGLGYVRANFKVSQAIGNLSGVTTGVGNGADIFVRYNYYFMERFGLNLGTGLELMNVKWKDPLLEYTETSSIYYPYYTYWELNQIDKELVMSWYFNIGLFVDVWKHNSMALRLFGNAGYGWHWFKGIYYKDELENTDNNSGYSIDFLSAAQGAGFFELGMRYIFAKHFGVDLVYKFNTGDMFKSQSENLAVKTTINRTNNFLIRFALEF